MPAQGDKIAVLLSSDGAGQSNAIVLGGYSDQPRPSGGEVLSVSESEIVVTGAFGGDFTTDRFINPYIPGEFLEGPVPLGAYRLQEPPRLTYAPGDPVHLSWDAAIPTILGIIGIPVAAPPPSVPPPSTPKPQAGTTKAPATRSNTWHPAYGWGAYAGSQGGGQQLYSGSWYGSTVASAWFYGDAFTNLGSKTITEIRFRLPARLNVGASGGATIHLHAHTSKTQPGSDVNRATGPHNIAVTHMQGARWITLPIAWASILKAGGGISLAGEPYVGYTGRIQDPESGRIEMDWTL